jgi:glycosyltransferase involved in cell wall biosynthesis
LRIGGAGPLEEVVRAAAGCDSRIRYVGWIEDHEKDGFFDDLDVLIVPSEVEEAAALVAVEGAVRGVPCVVSDRGGLPETPAARAFRARDPHALREAVEWFLSDERLAKASRRLLDLREQFLLSTHVESVERVLKAAAGQRLSLQTR